MARGQRDWPMTEQGEMKEETRKEGKERGKYGRRQKKGGEVGEENLRS